MAKLQQYLKIIAANKIAPSISTTFSLVQAIIPIMDMEILIPIDKEIEDSEVLNFKKNLY